MNRPSIMTPSKRFSGSARTAAGNATGKAVPGAGGGRHDPGGPGTRIRSGGGASAPELQKAQTAEEIFRLKRRIAELSPMLTEMNELAELTAHYYDRGYYRSEKYTL